MHDLEQEIRERAYHLWVQGGCVTGNAESHWLAAQREILAASLSTVARVVEVDRPKAAKVRNPKKKRRAA